MGFYYSQLFVTPQIPSYSFSGQTVIVTGSNVGLGQEASRTIARLGASKIILAVRNVEAGERAKKSIETSTNRPGVCEVWQLDLAHYDSVKAFASRASGLDRLDVLLGNAAIATPHFKSVEGHEQSITVNVISTMLLGMLLIPILRKTAKLHPGSWPRLTFVVSETHAWTKFAEWRAHDVFGTLDDQSTANMKERYATTKLLEILIVRELATRLQGSGVVVNMLNPGLCHSELARDSGWGLAIFKLLVARSTEVGSRTLVSAAAAGKESHGKYMTDGRVADDALSTFVVSEDGRQAQKKIWNELVPILESISPGILKDI